MTDSIAYPKTKSVDQVDDYHGTPVHDPYRWLEETDSDDTREWVAAQNAVTSSYLGNSNARAAIFERLQTLWDFTKYGLPSRVGNRFLWSEKTGLQNQAVLYVSDSPDGDARVLLDPNRLSEAGTVALSGYSASENGQYLAYCLATNGSDWNQWRVRDIETGEDLEDVIEWTKFGGVSWTHDHRGFFYSRFEEPSAESNALEAGNYHNKLFYHRIGGTQIDDTLIYERPDEKEWMFYGDVTEDGRYLIIYISAPGATKNTAVFYRDLEMAGSPIVELLNKFDASYSLLGNDGPVFWFQTDHQADNGRVIAIDIRNPAPENWKEVIPETDDAMQSANVVGNHFLVTYLKDACSRTLVFTLDGVLEREVALPDIGSAWGFGGRRIDEDTYYGFANFTTPLAVYRYDIKTGVSAVYRKPDVDFSAGNFEIHQVFYSGLDGTRIPMFMVHRKGLVKDGTNPTLLYGYGGFKVSITPSFSVENSVWLEMGGVLAMPTLRGGGEYGKHWHDSGRLERKQNVFDDFIAAGEWLIDNGYTSSDKLAISGGSNGGLLVGACMTQRPDLFRAALPAVGVLDMLRYHKFTIGWAWISEYGSSENAADFANLIKYSPLHNVKAGTQYPATFITTGDHDDRVVPAHSYKFAATLQAAHVGDPPILIRIETDAGHGAGKPTTKALEESADRLTFLSETLGMGKRSGLEADR